MNALFGFDDLKSKKPGPVACVRVQGKKYLLGQLQATSTWTERCFKGIPLCLPRELLRGDALASVRHRPIGTAIQHCEHARQRTSRGPGRWEMGCSAYHDGSLGVALNEDHGLNEREW